jgi:hypothetical protein
MMLDKFHQMYKGIVKHILDWIEILIKSGLFFKLMIIFEGIFIASAPAVKRRDRISK